MYTFFEKILGEKPTQITPLSGGDINAVFEVTGSTGNCVIKVNDDAKFPGMLAAEAAGLSELAATQTIRIPKVIACGMQDDKQFLVLEKITEGQPVTITWELFGQKLAAMHHCSRSLFGLDQTNYIGSLTQQNESCKTWTEFPITQRLQPMLEMAVNQGDVNYVEAKVFDALYARLDELIPVEKPALLHGDLWAGNFLTHTSGEPFLIDPAVYYGHREMDLAMMHLFGGFDAALFNTYHTSFPLEKGWQKRIELNQLYPLLVHVNLFGRSYWEKVQRIVEPFG